MSAPLPVISESSTEHEIFSAVETYAQLLELSHTIRVAAVILDRVRKHRSDHKSTISLEDAYHYKRGRALGTIERPPRPRGPRQLRIAPLPQQHSQEAAASSPLPQQPESLADIQQQSQPAPPSRSSSQRPESVDNDSSPSASVVAALNSRLAQHESEISDLRVQLERAVQLAERATADLALLRQQLEPPKSSRKRKPSTPAPIDPASLQDHPFTPAQAEECVEQCFVAWRLEEDEITIGWACISAVLTLLNHRLQRGNNPHVRFLPSYPGMETQNSDDPVTERCMGLNLANVRYVVAPVSIRKHHWALAVWDHEERRLLLLDSFDLVNGKQGTRLRRLLMRGPGKAQNAARVPVMQQDDNVSCGLFLLCFACYIVGNAGTWRESISAAGFSIDSMRTWLNDLKRPGASVNFTLEQLPSFTVAAPHAEMQSSETEYAQLIDEK